MTSKKALENIKDNYPLVHPTNYKLIKESYDTLEELVDRDTPMKPLIDKLVLWDEHKCPVCESTVWEVHVHKDENFCNNCGQRLDWGQNKENDL